MELIFDLTNQELIVRKSQFVGCSVFFLGGWVGGRGQVYRV